MKSWISFPLAFNYLLSLMENGPPFQGKFVQTYKNLRSNKSLKFSNKLYVSPSCDSSKFYKNSDIEVENIEYKNNNVIQGIIQWINQYDTFTETDIRKYILPSATPLLFNLSQFKGKWNCNGQSPVMKVHNSFTYTEDIKYEARLLELLMQDDFKLVLIIPNEVPSLVELFTTLSNEGLNAAVSRIQPMFTFSTVLEAPAIEFTSDYILSSICENSCDISNGLQLGIMKIDENGVNISMLTCIGSTYKGPVASIDENRIKDKSPFYFVVFHKDTTVFNGCYVKQIK